MCRCVRICRSGRRSFRTAQDHGRRLQCRTADARLARLRRAVQDDWSGSKNYYIADNTFIGRHDPDKMMSWIGAIWEKFPGFPELLTSEYAIKVYGQGHVVAHNYLAHWHDAIDIATYGNPDGSPTAIADRL